ncbi:unnamed protein product [Caenorhabditis angaria]|uniref:Phosphoglycerate mutase family protein n=1 Tax=Caenorhabditis angaria TaxID=860376 RepID=A0A9P1IFD8_9PELO|nr:unnamed protein product [Caenorhabditis angaria]
MAQKEKRSIWLVRHGERVDNVDKKWKEKNPNKWDDPELTVRGKKQAFEVGRSFHNINIERIICSPFIRCVETAVEIVAMMENKPKICIEPGFMEPLNACMDPPSIPSMETIKALSTRIDEEYKPVYDKIPQEVGDLGCGERVVKTLKGVTEKFPEGHLIIISHGVPIANLHVYLKGPWKYVGQGTLSKINDNYGNFVLEYYNKKTHLSQPSDLHDDERMFPKT